MDLFGGYYSAYCKVKEISCTEEWKDVRQQRGDYLTLHCVGLSWSQGCRTTEASSCLDSRNPVLQVQALKALGFLGVFGIRSSGQIEDPQLLSWPDLLVLWVWPLEGMLFLEFLQLWGLWPRCASSKVFEQYQRHVRFLFYAVMSACHIMLYLLGSKMWKLEEKIT